MSSSIQMNSHNDYISYFFGMYGYKLSGTTEYKHTCFFTRIDRVSFIQCK